MGRGRAGEAHRQPALFAPRDAGHALAKRLHLGQQALGFSQQHAAAGRQAHALGVASQQLQAQLGFQRLDLLAQRRLLDAQRGGSAGHVARLGHGGEVAQVAQVHMQIVSAGRARYI